MKVRQKGGAYKLDAPAEAIRLERVLLAGILRGARWLSCPER